MESSQRSISWRFQRKTTLANSRSALPNFGPSSGERTPPFLLRIHKLGHVDIFKKGPDSSLDQIVQRWMKVSSALLANQVETIFDDTLNSLAELALMERELPETFPDIEAMRPFLRPHPVGKLPGLTPWPATRHLYVAKDYEDLREVMASQPVEVSAVKNHKFLDYLQLGETDGDISESFDLKTLRAHLNRDEPDNRDDGFIDLRLSDLGTRLISSEGEIRVLQILIPADETTNTLITRLAGLMDAPGNGSHYKVAHFTTLSKDAEGNDQVKTSFLLVDSEDLIDASIGWSPKPGGHPLLSEEQASVGEWANAKLFKPLGTRSLLQMGLPAYFEFQLDAVEDNIFDGAGRRLIEETQDTGASTRKKTPRAYKPKMFKLVRALRYPRRELVPEEIGFEARGSSGSPRKEPDTQVSVKGFWRRIGEGAIGRDPNGNPVIGRT